MKAMYGQGRAFANAKPMEGGMNLLDLLEGDDWQRVRFCKWCSEPIVVYIRRGPRREFCNSQCKDNFFNSVRP